MAIERVDMEVILHGGKVESRSESASEGVGGWKQRRREPERERSGQQ